MVELEGRAKTSTTLPSSTTDPVLQNRHVLACVPDNFHLVGDHHHRKVHALLQISKQGKDRSCGLRIKCAGSLIAEENVRVVRQRTCDRNTLFLSSGEGTYGGVATAGETDQSSNSSTRLLILTLCKPDISSG